MILIDNTHRWRRKLHSLCLPFFVGAIFPLLYNEMSNNIIILQNEKSSTRCESKTHSPVVIEDHDDSNYSEVHYSCAKWANEPNRRKVLFVNFKTLQETDETYHRSLSKSNDIGTKGKLNLLSAMIEKTLHKSMKRNSFEIDHVFINLIEPNELKRLNFDSYHRVIYMIHAEIDFDDNSLYHYLLSNFNYLCKLRVVLCHDYLTVSDSEYHDKIEKFVFQKLHEKQILLESSDARGTQFFDGITIYGTTENGTMDDRVCALLEDDSLCVCPNPIFSVSYKVREDLRENHGESSRDIDCRSTFFMKKGDAL